MWTVMASYTTAVCPSPVLLPAASVKRIARSSWRPAVAFRSSGTGVKYRRPLTVTCAVPPEKERPPAISIPRNALLCPDRKEERWEIKAEKDHVKLWLQVPGLSDKDIEVTVITGEDVLEIKRKNDAAADPAEAHAVGAFHIRLLMTKDYDAGAVTANLKDGMLEVTVPKNPERKPINLGMPAPRGSN